MEAMPKRRSALAMVRALLALAPQVCKSSELLRSILLPPNDDLKFELLISQSFLTHIFIIGTRSIPRDQTS